MIGRILAHPWLYGGVAAAILGAGGLAWWRVSAWHSAYQERPALVAERDAAVTARKLSESAIQTQVEANQRLEHDTNAALRRAGAAAHDLAGRLRQYQAMRRPVCPAPAAPGVDHGAGRESGDSEEAERRIDRAVESHFTACARDAERLTGAQTYINGLPKRCVAD